MAKQKADGPTFEEALKQLEMAVDRLEEGTLPLSEALEVFEIGLKASNQCRSLLEDARQKVDVLMRDRGDDFELMPLDHDDEVSEDE